MVQKKYNLDDLNTMFKENDVIVISPFNKIKR